MTKRSQCFLKWYCTCNLRFTFARVLFSPGPSPPRNLRRSAVGVLGDREYHIFWTASSDTGGSAVNYSVKLCLNDSSVENNSCKWSSKPQCMPTNITCTTKKFSCTLDRKPYYNYILCVVASNAVGNSESCISAPRIPSGLGKAYTVQLHPMVMSNFLILYELETICVASKIISQPTKKSSKGILPQFSEHTLIKYIYLYSITFMVLLFKTG